jgi:hypothetical protein
MKIFKLLILTILITTVSLATAREWKQATIVITSQTNTSWPLWGEKDTLHYTIETTDMIYFVEYTYKAGSHNNSRGLDIPLNVETKIAIAGKHAYILDTRGKEVKLHIVKKTAK